MPDIQQHLDFRSKLVIATTIVLFVAAIFIKGLGHELLLEAGVFLVSVKLIMMAHKNSVATRQMNDRLDGLKTTLTRMESLFASGRLSELAEKQPNNMPQPARAAYRSDEAKGRDRAVGSAPPQAGPGSSAR